MYSIKRFESNKLIGVYRQWFEKVFTLLKIKNDVKL